MPQTAKERMRGMKAKVVVKTTNECNLECPYCYNRFQPKDDMTHEVIEEFMKKFGHRIHHFLWHGGEATMMGIDFIRDGCDIVKKYNKDMTFTMQTNATLITEDWINLFKEYNIKPGSSYDGIHNEKTRNNTKILKKRIHQIKDAGINIGTIMVYNKDNVGNLIDEYNHLKTMGWSGKFNPVFEVGGTDDQYNLLNSQIESEGLIKFFEYWMHDVRTETNKPYDIGLMGEYLNPLFGSQQRICHRLDSCLGLHLSLKPNGDLYPCGRDWHPKYCYGNVFEMNDFDDIFDSAAFKELEKLEGLIKEDCKHCILRDVCNSGCMAENVVNQADVKKPNQKNCGVYQEVFAWIFEQVKNIDPLDNDLDKKYNPYFIEYLRKEMVIPISKVYEIENKINVGAN
jgi:uncharacterized protein